MHLHSINRFQASATHLLGSLCVAAAGAALVYLVWYPGPHAAAAGISAIYLLLLGVDVVLGPLMTLIIFNPKKKELKLDLAILVVVQLSALAYGLHAIFITRPVYLVFNTNRFDTVYANDISAQRLDEARGTPYAKLPLWGPRIVAARLPADPKLREEIVANAVAGNGEDVQQMPKYYLPYADARADALAVLRPFDDLRKYNKDRGAEVDAAQARAKAAGAAQPAYLPLKAKVQDLTVVVDGRSAAVLDISALKPWRWANAGPAPQAK